jgi:hypothetical protein
MFFHQATYRIEIVVAHFSKNRLASEWILLVVIFWV